MRENRKFEPLTDQQKEFIDLNYNKLHLKEIIKKLYHSKAHVAAYMKEKEYQPKKKSGDNRKNRKDKRATVDPEMFDYNQKIF